MHPGNITFEVTETGIIGNLEAAKEYIRNCRSAGSRIALDDFGTGLSSLSYLKQFSLDLIKIDVEGWEPHYAICSAAGYLPGSGRTSRGARSW